MTLLSTEAGVKTVDKVAFHLQHIKRFYKLIFYSPKTKSKVLSKHFP